MTADRLLRGHATCLLCEPAQAVPLCELEAHLVAAHLIVAETWPDGGPVIVEDLEPSDFQAAGRG